MENAPLTRYSEITEKNRREIVLLRGSGCKWRRCTFCDYHLDFSPDETSNFALNQEVLGQIRQARGHQFGKLCRSGRQDDEADPRHLHRKKDH